MSKHKDATFQVRIDEDELALARKRAEQQGLSLSSVVRRLLHKFIQDPEIALDESDEHAEYDHEHAKRSKR